MEHTKRVDERFDDFLKKVDVMETELKEWKDKYLGLENKLNETITMTNELILNVNGANQFIASLHNALHKAGLIDSPEQIKKEADKLLQMDMEKQKNMEPEPEPEMDEVN